MGKKLGEELGGGAGEGAGRETERRDSAEETEKGLVRDCEEETGIRAGRRDWGEEPGLVRPGCQDESLLVSLIYHPTKYITNLSPVPTVSFSH